MLGDFLIPFGAAIVAAVLLALLERPREWIVRQSRRVRNVLSLRRHEAMQLAIARIAAELTERACREEGNPDDEYRDDLYRWFTGDPDANIDYSRKQQRDLERLKQGFYNPR